MNETTQPAVAGPVEPTVRPEPWRDLLASGFQELAAERNSRFAGLLAGERERCVAACRAQAERWTDDRARWAAMECAAAIEAMGAAIRHDDGRRATQRELWAEIERLRAEIERLGAALRQANDQAEHFERLWYLTNEDAGRYAFAKTLEGQVVTMETFKRFGAEALDQALDDAMMEAADAQNEAGYGA